MKKKKHFRQKSSQTNNSIIFEGVIDKELFFLKMKDIAKKKKITALRVRKLSPTLLLTELSQR